jgi:pimeloyl-ACP methyl ester carboxylesterase
MLKQIATDLLDMAYDEQGDADGWPVVLLHGFPYDIHAYEEVAPRLTSRGARVISPYLRGYGATRFLAPTTLRSGEQAALGADLLALLDALQIGQATLGGYDWGGRAACIVAALYPSRARGLVSVNGYNIQKPTPKTNTGCGTSTTFMASAAGLDSLKTGASSVVSYGRYGRRPGASTTTPTRARQRRSTIPISSTWSSILTGTVSDWSTAIHSLTISSAACPPCRRSRCPRSRSKGTPMAFRRPGEDRQTHSASLDGIRTASWRTLAIIFRRRHPKPSLTRSSTSTHGPPDGSVSA